MPPHLRTYGAVVLEMMLYQQDSGYYGLESERLVARAAEQARGTPNTLGQYLDAHPVAAL